MAFKKVVKETPVVQQEDGVLLELSLYNRYNRHGKHYEKGTGNQPIVYRFTKDAAVILLGEVDNGRPVWRVHKVKTAVQLRNDDPKAIHDMTSADLKPQPDNDAIVKIDQGTIEIGNDEEIASILGKTDDEGEVTGEVVTV
jgi:hypothetical protein